MGSRRSPGTHGRGMSRRAQHRRCAMSWHAGGQSPGQKATARERNRWTDGSRVVRRFARELEVAPRPSPNSMHGWTELDGHKTPPARPLHHQARDGVRRLVWVAVLACVFSAHAPGFLIPPPPPHARRSPRCRRPLSSSMRRAEPCPGEIGLGGTAGPESGSRS